MTPRDPMDLILWRHADAQDGNPDLERPLTAKGRLQARKMAAWLNQRMPQEARILVSPAPENHGVLISPAAVVSVAKPGSKASSSGFSNAPFPL